MPGEFDTRPLLEAAFADRKRVFLPRVEDVARRRMSVLEAFSLEDVDAFPRSNWGIPEPPRDGPDRADAAAAGVDLVVVPGVAFDADRGRLGQGAGFYDTFLAALPGEPFCVGVGLGRQFLPQPDLAWAAVPREAHDRVLDLVLGPEAG